MTTKMRIRVKAWTRPHTAEVVRLPVVTSLDCDPLMVLDGAMQTDLTDVVVIGCRPDGSEYFASSIAYGPDALWLLERIKSRLLDIVDEIPPREPVSGGGRVLPFKGGDQ